MSSFEPGGQMAAHDLVSKPRFVVGLVAIVAAGVPLVAYLWETVNQLLAGRVSAARLAVSTPVLLVFLALLYAGGRLFTRAAAAAAPTDEHEPDVSGALLLTAVVLMFIFGVWVMMYVLLLER